MLTEKMQVLISMHNEYRGQARWLEDRRENTSKMIIAANFVLLGFIVNAEFGVFTLALAPLIFVLAHWGQYFSAKYFLLSERDYARARVMRDRIDEQISNGSPVLEEIFNAADREENQNVYPEYGPEYMQHVRDTSLHLQWLGIHKAFKLMSVFTILAILVNAFVPLGEFLSPEVTDLEAVSPEG